MGTNGRVANKDIDRTEEFVSVFSHCSHCIVTAHIGDKRQTARTCCFDFLYGLLERGDIAASVHHHIRALPRQFDRNGFAYVTACASYYGGPPALIKRHEI